MLDWFVDFVGNGVFAATMVLLYFCSTLCHTLPQGSARGTFLRLDLGAIYLFIASSFTPLAMVSLDTICGWTVLALVWLIALAGFVLKACGRLWHPLASTGLYLLMGQAGLTIALSLI